MAQLKYFGQKGIQLEVSNAKKSRGVVLDESSWVGKFQGEVAAPVPTRVILVDFDGRSSDEDKKESPQKARARREAKPNIKAVPGPTRKRSSKQMLD